MTLRRRAMGACIWPNSIAKSWALGGNEASLVTSAGFGPSVGRYLLMSYLPLELAHPGTDLQVMYMNELYPVKVASTGAVFDPDDTRMKA